MNNVFNQLRNYIKNDKKIHIYCFNNGSDFYAFDYYNYALVCTNETLNEMLGSLNDYGDFMILFQKYSDKKYKQYWEFIVKCFNNNIFISEEIHNDGIDKRKIGYASFPPVHDCNLSCKYCFADSGNNYIDNNKQFSKDQIFSYFEFICELYKSKQKIRIDLVSGGEPFLNFEIIKNFVEVKKEFEKKTKKEIMIWICTNATLLNEEICQFLSDNDISIGISLDGNRKNNDQNRVFKNGTGTYDIVTEKIKYIKENHKFTSKFKDIWGLVVLTPLNNDLVEILHHHRTLGIKNVQMKLVRSSKEEFIFKNEDVEILKSAYCKLYCFLLSECIKNNFDYVKMILNENDYFGKILKRIFLKKIVLNRCMAGNDKFTICANGDIYPCDSFVGNEKFKLGNIKSGINNNAFSTLCVQKRPLCSRCWARFICGGDCFHNSYLKNKDILKPDEMFCNIQKHLILLSIMFIFNLNQKNPDAFHKLCRWIQLKERVNGEISEND